MIESHLTQATETITSTFTQSGETITSYFVQAARGPVGPAATGTGSGDVVGPASATDGRPALFDGVTGKLLKVGNALGTAAFTAATDYATAAQGGKADTAVQPAALGTAAAADTTDFDPAGAAAAITLSGLGGVATTDARLALSVDINRQGFVGITSTSIGFSDGTTKTFTLTDTGSGWSYYRDGIKRTITGNKTVNLSATTAGAYYIYIDATDGTLTCSAVNASWDLSDSKIPVAVINYNSASTPTFWISDERHTCAIDWRDQYYIHHIEGTKAKTVPSITGTAVVNGTADADKTFGLSAAALMDQDREHTIALLGEGDGTTTPYVVWYRTAAAAWSWVASAMPFPYNIVGTNNIVQWDNGGTMTDGTIGVGAATRYLNSYVLMTNKTGDARYIIVPGRAQFTTVALAQAEAISGFDWTGFSIDESVILYRLTWKPVTGASKGSCVLAATPQLVNISTVTNVSAGAGIDHNTLSNLNGGDYQHLTAAQLAPATAAQIAGTPSIRAIGTGATEAAAGNHGHAAYQNISRIRRVYWPAGAMVGATTLPAAAATIETGTNKVMVDSMDFDSGTNEEIAWVTGALEDWDAGDVSFKVAYHFSVITTGTTVEFEITGRSYGDGDILDSAMNGDVVTCSDTLQDPGDTAITEASAAATLAGTPARDEVQFFRISRNTGNDDGAGDARVLGLWIEYTTATTEATSWLT